MNKFEVLKERLQKISESADEESGTEDYLLQEVEYLRKRLLNKDRFKEGRKPKFVYISPIYEPENIQDISINNDKSIRCRDCGAPIAMFWNHNAICLNCIKNKTTRTIFGMIFSVKSEMDIMAETQEQIIREKFITLMERIEKLERIIEIQHKIIKRLEGLYGH